MCGFSGLFSNGLMSFITEYDGIRSKEVSKFFWFFRRFWNAFPEFLSRFFASISINKRNTSRVRRHRAVQSQTGLSFIKPLPSKLLFEGLAGRIILLKKHISCSPDCFDEAGMLGIIIEFLTQPTHQNINGTIECIPLDAS